MPGRGVIRTSRERLRVAGLDGIRGLAALYVVLNHLFLRAFPGYPHDTAPAWAAWFIYGRFAVVVFIVLSGFSLAIAPARNGWRLDGLSRFARRRAWRILPAYWAALLFSLAMTWFVVAQPGWPVPNGSSVVVDGLLLQDVVTVPSPNRAFWSIAIEAQLYVALPLLLLLCRRISAVAMAGTVAVVVVSVGALGEMNQSVGSLVTQLTPDLAVLFAVGILAAGIVVARQRERDLAVALAGGGLRRARDRDRRPARVGLDDRPPVLGRSRARPRRRLPARRRGRWPTGSAGRRAGEHGRCAVSGRSRTAST